MIDAYTAQEMKDLETRFSEEFKQYMEEARRGGGINRGMQGVC
jgi:hypothetical protein